MLGSKVTPSALFPTQPRHTVSPGVTERALSIYSVPGTQTLG